MDSLQSALLYPVLNAIAGVSTDIHVIGGAEFTVARSYISVCEVYVHSNYFKTGMAQYALERKDIPTVSEVTYRKRVAKCVWGAPYTLDTGLSGVFFDYRFQTVD